MNKATSIYLKDDTIFMLPRELATDLVSLNHNTTRLSQTVQIDYDDQMNVVNSNFYESKFYNKYRFDYSSFRDQYFSE
jgi:exoribonuclease R